MRGVAKYVETDVVEQMEKIGLLERILNSVEGAIVDTVKNDIQDHVVVPGGTLEQLGLSGRLLTPVEGASPAIVNNATQDHVTEPGGTLEQQGDKALVNEEINIVTPEGEQMGTDLELFQVRQDKDINTIGMTLDKVILRVTIQELL